MSPSECQKPAFNRVLRVFSARHIAQALGGDRADGCERILDAVVKFLQDQLLEFVGRLALLGVNTGLSKKFPRINFGLRQQQPKADVLRLQKFIGRSVETGMALVLTKVSSRHGQLYHLVSDTGQNNRGGIATQ